MNKKKVSITIGVLLLVLLGIYLYFNPAWITHPKYMLDSQYCEQDSDCIITYSRCDAINIYNEYKGPVEFGSGCLHQFCSSSCNNNKCQLVACIKK